MRGATRDEHTDPREPQAALGEQRGDVEPVEREAALALLGQWLDCLWLVAPSLRPDGFSVHWLDVAALIAEGAPWLALVIALAVVCGLALLGQWLDCLWLVAPSLRPDGFSVHWLDVAALIAEGALWLALVVALAERAFVAPAPRLAGATAHG